MPDLSESPRRQNNAHAAPLQYPTFPPLSASVQEWLSHSRPTNMTSDRPGDPPTHPLSESWATLSVSDVHSEDGSRCDQTDAGSLIGQTTPDDVASLDERYSGSDVGVLDEDDDQEFQGPSRREIPTVEESQDLTTLFAQSGTSIEDSNLTTRPPFRQPSESIEFVEPEKWPERERIELKHTIRIFDDAAASEMKSRLRHHPTDSILMATVQQTMTKQGMDLDKPFRVLYIGQANFRNIILDKIGDVLVSSSSAGSQTSSAESSRYHVVPTSFGVGAVPNYAELLPIHVQLVVDECLVAQAEEQYDDSTILDEYVEATVEAPPDQSTALYLQFKNRPSCRSWWDGEKYRVSSTTEWTLPDMAIFFVSSEDDSKAQRTRDLAQTFLNRHEIPAMMISEEPLWETANENISAVNPDSLHMCLESRHPQTGETRVLKRYPIDLETFESITPGQLNRNLSSLMDLYPKKAVKATADTRKPVAVERTSYFDLEKYPYNLIPPSYATKARELAPLLRLVTLFLVSAIILSLGYAVLKAMIIILVQWVAGSSLSNALPAGTSALPTTALDVSGIRQTSISTRHSGNLEVLPDHSPDFSTGERAVFTISTPSSSLDTLEIQVVGDCHVIIKPPRSLASSKKQPRFNVSVHRYDQALPYELSPLFEGVYTLRLERENAYGLVNVTVTAISKPPLNRTTTLDFGTPWLKIASWRRAARMISSHFSKDLQTAQTGLSEVYGRLTTDLQVIMGDVVKRSHFLRKDVGRLNRGSSNARDTVLSRSKQISQVLTRNAIQRFQSASSILRRGSETIKPKNRGLFSNVWSRAGETAASANVRSMMERVRSAKCATLDRAQARVHQIMGLRGRN